MRPLTIDQLIALNEQLLSLSQSGVPLATGLATADSELTGSVQDVTSLLAEKIESGASLEEALSAPSLPPLYLAVVRIGMRTGRLSLALEALATVMERIKEMRHSLTLAVIYPLAIAVTAYVFFLVSVSWTSLPVIHALADVDQGDFWLHLLLPLRNTIWLWVTAPPVIGAILLGWFFTKNSYLPKSQNSFHRRFVRSGRMACMIESLAMLMEQDVPLSEALQLSANAFGDSELQQQCNEAAARIERGEKLEHDDFPRGIPPLARWLLVSPATQADLPQSLRRLAQRYHEIAVRQTQWYRHVLPTWLACLVGGIAVGGYSLLVFGPWIQLLWSYGLAL